VPEYEAHFIELLQYAPHLNTEKLKVNRLVFNLNGSICVKVRILMPEILHDVVQKALIIEEEIISGGQRRTPTRPAGEVTYGA
jgi:hypothetical protein